MIADQGPKRTPTIGSRKLPIETAIQSCCFMAKEKHQQHLILMGLTTTKGDLTCLNPTQISSKPQIENRQVTESYTGYLSLAAQLINIRR